MTRVSTWLALEGARTGAARLETLVPAVDWLGEAFRQAGCWTSPLTVYARAL
jgi:hypothetical protein